ncbi:hypothetical protein CTAYLR_002701 [Chrysophaeum taylorii]|uniref:DNA-directed RNA polymerase subunit beta n=1 Tax=Chrysophaeum taylorii TaxID=2483200 RepID=A0AAD7UBI1_9STRA|nr:hypothetical protein CTAYLR_002701 [Chrysophaeum taylorii]
MSCCDYAKARKFVGPERPPLGAPYVPNKWELLPHFLRLMKQHIASYDYFVNTEIKKVVGAASNRIVRSEVDPNFFLCYTDVYVGSPSIEEDAFTTTEATPFECRLRDATYSAPIYVDVRYRRGAQIVTMPKVAIGRIPIMLRSSKCVLSGKSDAELADMKECPLDPGGYFVVKGVEKVILMQEQLSKNRCIIEDNNGPCATITSSTHERKSRCSIFVKNSKVFLRHNTVGEIPVVVVLKAMGMESDQEIFELAGIVDASVRTQKQALEMIGEAIRAKQETRRPLSAEDEAREVLANVVLSHVPVVDYDFTAKRAYIGYATRRVLAAEWDDKDYYGNKRLELAGQLLSLLFEDLFKRFNADLKRSAELVLQKQNRAAVFDIVKSTVWQTSTITQGFVHAISTGNWVLKRFKMDRAGVTQVLSRLSYVSAIGMTTRVNSQFEKTRKTSGPRALQPSQWGMLCVEPGALVLLADGSCRRLDSLQALGPRAAPEITVVDPSTRASSPSSIAAFQRADARDYGRSVLRVTTASGRSIVVSEDHQFAVPGGSFVPAGSLRVNDRVLVLPTPLPEEEEAHEDPVDTMPTTRTPATVSSSAAPPSTHAAAAAAALVLDRQTFLARVADANICCSDSRATADADELEQAGLLPLTADDRRLATLAALVGYNLCDGHMMGKSAEFYVGCIEDGEALRDAARSLGVGAASDGFWHDSFNPDEGRQTERREFRIDLSGALSTLLLALGAVAGNKTHKSIAVPEFVVAGSREVKISFLSGTFGGRGNGGAMWYIHKEEKDRDETNRSSTRWRVTSPTLKFSKQLSQVDSLNAYLETIRNLLHQFGVETTSSVYYYEKDPDRAVAALDEDADPIVQRQLDLSRNYDNLLRFARIIGYKWCKDKRNKMLIASEYVRYCANVAKITEEQTQRRALELNNQGLGSMKISRRLGLSEGVIRSWLGRKENIIRQTKTKFPESNIVVVVEWDQWLRDTRACVETSTLYDAVQTIETLKLAECPVVCDLTTTSHVHTFVSNGFVTHNCPADTPEGETCGLVKNLALLAHVTTDAEVEVVQRTCFDLGVEQLGHLGGADLNAKNRGYLVFLNGLVVGACSRPHKLVAALRRMRRSGKIGEFVSVYAHDVHGAIYIACDGGRVCRPLIIAPNGRSRLTPRMLAEALGKARQRRPPRLQQEQQQRAVVNKKVVVGGGRSTTDDDQQRDKKALEEAEVKTKTLEYLVERGVVEYVDVNEENNCLIALDERGLTPEHTHVEIDPVTVLGVVSGLVAFPHHNQSPRNTYQCAMGKQAMGIVATNHYERMDSLLYSLIYPQKPMVKSRVLDLISFDSLPGGCNASLAVMSYSGYDIEDAVILNKASLDRGFMRCLVMRKHQTSIKRYANNTSDRTLRPPPAANFTQGENDSRYRRFAALGHDGICRVGEKLQDHAIMVNREVPIEDRSAIDAPPKRPDPPPKRPAGSRAAPRALPAQPTIAYKPQPLSYKGAMPSVVDRVLLTSNENDSFLVKVMLRQVRRPEIGDKFASRHGQKGVCGAIVPQDDMPFSDLGVCPDLVMNPHGFPSRMTVGKIIELVAGKAGVFAGRQAYGTAFGEDHGSADRAREACEALVSYGYSYVGKDMLYSGVSGEPLRAYIFMGPVFYQKLKHMVMDKMHARARGPRAQLTRQPTEGRSRDGGLRLGEMERDCLISYGAANLITERLMISSDAFDVYVCEKCGLLGYSTAPPDSERSTSTMHTSWCQNCRSDEFMARIRIPYACKLLFQELQSMNVTPRLKLENM